VILETPRLRLRPCRRDDIDVLHAMWTDAGVRRYLWDDQVIDRATAQAVVESLVESWRVHHIGLYLIYRDPLHGDPLYPGEAAIGFCGLRQFGEHGEWELLYGLLPAHWGQGYAVEASRAVLSHGFRILRCDRIASRTDPPNAASMRVMEKLGLDYGGIRVEDGRETVCYWSYRHEWNE
jgi:RimJ/RimL family protein N-acetyltransferase